VLLFLASGLVIWLCFTVVRQIRSEDIPLLLLSLAWLWGLSVAFFGFLMNFYLVIIVGALVAAACQILIVSTL